MEINKQRIIELAKTPEVAEKASFISNILSEIVDSDEEMLAVHSLIGVAIKNAVKELDAKMV